MFAKMIILHVTFKYEYYESITVRILEKTFFFLPSSPSTQVPPISPLSLLSNRKEQRK
jgi:hypothetical protein